VGVDNCEADDLVLADLEDTLGIASVRSTVVVDRPAGGADLEETEKLDAFQAINTIAPMTATIAKDNEVFRFIAL
jgi:hypothetical protein